MLRVLNVLLLTLDYFAQDLPKRWLKSNNYFAIFYLLVNGHNICMFCVGFGEAKSKVIGFRSGVDKEADVEAVWQ